MLMAELSSGCPLRKWWRAVPEAGVLRNRTGSRLANVSSVTRPKPKFMSTSSGLTLRSSSSCSMLQRDETNLVIHYYRLPLFLTGAHTCEWEVWPPTRNEQMLAVSQTAVTIWSHTMQQPLSRSSVLHSPHIQYAYGVKTFVPGIEEHRILIISSEEIDSKYSLDSNTSGPIKAVQSNLLTPARGLGEDRRGRPSDSVTRE